MPGKPKKLVQSSSSNSGFLRPTLASQRRCVHNQADLLLTNGKKKRSEKSRKRLLNQSTFQTTKQNDIRSAVEVYGARSTSTSENSYHDKHNGSLSQSHSSRVRTNDDLTEAKKMCEELQKQIDELKLNQENLRHRHQAMHKMEAHDSSQSHSTQTSARLLESAEKSKCSELNYHPNSVIKVNFKPKHKPLVDASNTISEIELPNVKAYHAAFRKPHSPEKIIKKLHSERDKYKNKVVKLQTELKLVRRSKEKMTKSPEVSIKDLTYYTTDMIGEGRLSVVYSGELSGKKVAVKKLTKSGMLSSSDRSYLAAEAGLLIHLQHKHIVKVHGVCSTPMEPLIVTEFVYGRTVADFLEDSGNGIEPAKYFSIARDTAIGLAYLHNQRPPVLHLNLLPSNIFVDAFGRAKVSDFGFSKIRVGNGVSHPASLAYLAPELLRYPVHLTVKIDVYAYAIILWQMHDGGDPVHGRSASQILDMLQSNERLPLPLDMPLSFHSLINKCWAMSPLQRPTFKDIILELETMPLPAYWLSRMKESGVSRMDTSDLSSSLQDTNSLSSALTGTDTSKGLSESATNCKASDYPSAHSKEPKTRTEAPLYADRDRYSAAQRSRAARSRTSNTRFATRERHSSPTERGLVDPAPCNEVRYVSQDIHEQIGQSEVVSNGHNIPKLLAGVDQLRPHLSVSRQHYDLYPGAGKSAAPARADALGGDTGEDRAKSKFDDKFQSYVNDACRAESASKFSGSQLRGPKSATLSSSDHIRVRSLSTPSDSTTRTTDRSSSNETTVYLPPRSNPSFDLRGGALSAGRGSTHEPSATKTVADRLREDYRRSDAVMNNAKRLLLSSPIRRGEPGFRTSNYLDLPSAHKNKPKSLPSRYQHNRAALAVEIPRQRYPSSEPSSGPLASPRSEDVISQESFVPLPPALNSRSSYTSPLSKDPREGPDHVREAWKPPSDGGSDVRIENFLTDYKKHEEKPVHDFDDQMSSKIADVLQTTAEQLNGVSNVLQSAAEERRSFR